MASFGQHLRDLRKQARLSQRDLAEHAGIDFTYLSKIENERVEPPSEAVITRLARDLAGPLQRDATELADELIILAGKFPSDVAAMLSLHSFTIAELRRSLSGDVRSREDWLKRLRDEGT